jgi:hypothetical protein
MTTPASQRTTAERDFFARWGAPDQQPWHHNTVCHGQFCVIHNPSDHHLRHWPMIMRETTLIERHCQHGVGHPDPDSYRALNRIHYGQEDYEYGFGYHGCDGCCKRQPATIRETW